MLLTPSRQEFGAVNTNIFSIRVVLNTRRMERSVREEYHFQHQYIVSSHFLPESHLTFSKNNIVSK